ncbi:sulfite exporter TauE/SafE family protein [Roseibium aestuarii]|uniref:Probable membrane transporter protein n=1 Tax=Roseibium aestuarii TaxID=2600299 RepID=A0ABW4JUD9_9HYPH|nr:sulfite exporter TauE/SafE family protein [Roseibium aestuarii]
MTLLGAIDPLTLVLALVACGLGGLLKGATGAGAPVIGIPVLTALVDIQFAVSVFVLPNLLTNLWQAFAYRRHLLPWSFLLLFGGGGAIGAVVGTYLLAGLPGDLLEIAMALVVIGYVAFRLWNMDWVLAYPLARKLALPVGGAGGILQGATGLSAPASLTFLNALRLPRPTFIATISVFFALMTISQIERQAALGLLDGQRLLIGAFATLATLAAMPVGRWIGERVSRQVFDWLILGLLLILALKILLAASLA